MPKKNIYANIKPYEGQDINQYRDYVKTSIKQNDPELNDVFLDDLADEYISTSKPSQKVQAIAQPTQPTQPTQSAPQRPSKLVEQMMAATSKKQVLPTPTPKKPLKPQAETTGEALSEFLPQMQAPTLKDPFAEAAKVTNPALESLLATGVQGEPKKVEAPVQSAPSVSNRLLEQEAAQIPLRNQISKEIAQRQKDAFDIEAERNLPQADEAQKQVFAQTLRDNELAKQQYQGQLKANQIPRGEFDKIIDLNATAEKNIARAELASTLAPKGSNDVSSIKEMLDEYSRSPEFQTDVYTYAQGNSIPDLKEAASKMLDQKAKEFTQAPSTIQRGLSEFANTKFGRAISPVTRGVQAAIKAPVEIGGFLGAVASSLGEVYKDPSKSLTETIAKKNQANQAIAGRFVPSLAPTKQATTNFEAIADFLGDVGESVGAIEGGMTATRGLGNFFDKARKVGAYGSTSELAQLAAHSGKTMATDVLSKASQVLRGKNAIKTAQILDNTTKNMIMMGGQTMEAKRQEYEDAGFSHEEAADKAKNAAIISSFALSLPGVMRPHNESMVKNIVGESGYKGFTPLQDLLQRGKGAVKQGVNFAVDMAAINAATGGYDKLFEGGLKQAGHDFLVGAVSRVMSGQDGIRKVSQSQKRALVDAIESPDKLNLSITESGGSPEQIRTARSFIETIRPYYNEAVNERGYNKEQAIEDAIERTKMVQAGRKLAQMEAQAPLYQGENKEFNLEYERLNDIYNTSRQALEAVKNGISLNPNRLVSADQMAEIVKNYSIVRPEQKVPIELNAPYYSEPIPTSELAKDPKVKEALKQFEGSELVNDAYIDVVPVIGENGEVIDGAKGAAAAIARGQKQMYAFKSTSTNDVKKVANELYQESVSDKPDFEGLDEVHTKALKEMRKVYDKTMRETNEDIYEGVNSVVKDALERGYDKADVINMARKVNNGILSETVVEKMYNDQMKEKVEPVKEVTPKEATEEMQVVSENPKKAAETEQIAETTKEVKQPSEKVEQIETPTESVTKVKIEPTKEPVSESKEPQIENEALKDVESTAKALKKIDVKKTTPLEILANENEPIPEKKKISVTNRNGNWANVFNEAKDVVEQSTIIRALSNTKNTELLNEYLDLIQGLPNESNTVFDILSNFENKEQKADAIKKILKGEYSNNTKFDVLSFLKNNPEIDALIPAKIKVKPKVIPKSQSDIISEAYHKAKSDGSNPELVKAVEDLLSPQKVKASTIPTDKVVEQSSGGSSVGGDVDKPANWSKERLDKEIEKLDPYESQGYGVTRNRSLKESMADFPDKARLAFELRDFFKRIYKKDFEKDFDKRPLSSLGQFFYTDAKSLKDWVDNQIEAINDSIKSNQEYIDGLSNSKSDTKSKEMWADTIEKSKSEIENLKSEYKKYEQEKSGIYKKSDNVEISAKNSIIEQNKETTDFGKVISASSRFRPAETVVFDKPIIGKNGNKLISYQWAYEWTMQPSGKDSELKSKRISDWTQAESSAETGRGIVHKFTVERKDGTIVTVSSETIPSLLGYVDAAEMKNLPSLVSSVKTLAKQRMQLAILKAQETEYNNIKQEVEKGGKPNITVASKEELPFVTRKMIDSGRLNPNDFTYFKMGDVTYRQDGNSKTPTKETIEQLTDSWVKKEVENKGGKKPSGLYDLERRIERQEKKVEQATGSKLKAVEELLTPKTQENAISQPKTNEVLPRKQGEIREAGSERKRVGQGEQGVETPRKDSEGVQKENVKQKVIPEKEAKKAFEDVLTAHVKELNKDEVSAVELKKAAEKAQEAKAKSEDIKFLSENFKDVLLLLKEKAGIEVKNIEDC